MATLVAGCIFPGRQHFLICRGIPAHLVMGTWANAEGSLHCTRDGRRELGHAALALIWIRFEIGIVHSGQRGVRVFGPAPPTRPARQRFLGSQSNCPKMLGRSLTWSAKGWSWRMTTTPKPRLRSSVRSCISRSWCSRASCTGPFTKIQVPGNCGSGCVGNRSPAARIGQTQAGFGLHRAAADPLHGESAGSLAQGGICQGK